MSNQDVALSGVAIIGMAGRFPGARNVAEFWRNLYNGVESVTFYSDEELLAAGASPDALKHPDCVRAKGAIADAELFDAGFFGYTPREAVTMDPQQRLFLECAWEALESAGYNPQDGDNCTGVFAGTSINTYSMRNMNVEPFRSMDGFELGMSGDKDFLATRVSYKLNLKGPSIVVQAACATSLVAVCQACQSLLDYQCDMALAGGVSVKQPRISGYVYKQGGIASRDGHTKTFDVQASGTITGEGVAAVVLKRLEDAVADGDTIYAVIKGFALNNDGAMKVGFTAPSVDGQAEVIRMAQAVAGFDPDSISYIEAHGTATAMGDPIEIAALTQAFRASTQRKGFCGIGSAKSNLGHLDAAAGVAGLIKASLAAAHREIPPSLHFTAPNPELDLANSPFFVVDKLTPWTGPLPLRAGISAFGIGGTNAHVVIEEAPALTPSGASRTSQLLVLSARSEAALDAAVGNLADQLTAHPEQNLADVAYTLQIGRRAFDWRTAIVCRDAAEARKALAGRGPRARAQGKERPVVFAFTGQGAQYPHMGEGLYRSEAVFRDAVDQCCAILQQRLALDLKPLLYPAAGAEQPAAERLRDTQYTQPALFVTEYALAQLWMSWGIEPEAMIGHSIGEYVAACLAEVMSLEHALELVARRGKLISALPRGSMLAVPLAEEEVRQLLGDASLAAVNAPNLCVLSGPTETIDRLEAQLRGRNLDPVRLHTSHAFHSAMMEPALAEFRRYVAQVPLAAPKRPYISNLTGDWIRAEQATDADYWVQHMRQAVRFSAGVQRLLENPQRVFLEMGPGTTLTGLIRQHLAAGAATNVIAAMRGPRDVSDDLAFVLDALGKAWMAGASVNWRAFSAGERRRRVALPTYPFERKKYWIDECDRLTMPGRQMESGQPAPAPVTRRADPAEWLYIPTWVQTASATDLQGLRNRPERWLIFADETGLADELANRLRSQADSTILVRAGAAFAANPDGSFTINETSTSDCESLLASLRARGGAPTRIAHLRAVTAGGIRISDAFERYFWHPVCLAKALGTMDVSEPIELSFVSDGVQEVIGDEPLCPEKALLLGPNRVITQEFPHILCRSIDLPVVSGENRERVLTELVGELRTQPSEGQVAFRGMHRWVRSFAPAPVRRVGDDKSRLRERGVYLITGGLGGIGMAIAEDFAKTLQARLILVGRSPMPARAQWDAWLTRHSETERTSQRIRRIRAMETVGAEIMLGQADVADAAAMAAIVAEARRRFGAIHGVIHSAGVPAGGIIPLKTRESAEAVIGPKFHGTLVLHSLFHDAPLDFMVLCSSLTAVIGSPGQVDYTAANAFLDAFAEARGREPGRWTSSIEWDAWSESGMAVDTQVPPDLQEVRRRDLALGIRDAEGAALFRRILGCSLRRVMVSARELMPRLRPAPEASPAVEETASKAVDQPSASGHARPASLSAEYVAPRTDTERAVAAVWQELIGIDQIGASDNFLEAGGHSLLAIQMVSRLAKDTGVKLSVTTMFEAPTVALLAAEIDKLRATKADEECKLAEVLDMVENLSDEEVSRMLAENK